MALDMRTPNPVTANRQRTLMSSARTSASFDSFELTCMIYGSAHIVKDRRAAFERVETILGTRDTSVLPSNYAYTSREDLYMQGLTWGKAAIEDSIQYQHPFFDNSTPQNSLANSSPFGMTRAMVELGIQLCASEEQKRQWLPLFRTGKMIGAYCQTELGHGTFVRGLETTATWDPDTDEFVIHSPTLSSTKFWPGALGFSCTHALVMAQLVVQSKTYGPHLFMVQLRSLEDGTPLPGITLGDIGPKMSYNTTCNGFATFDQVHISRKAMLMGHAKVTSDGSYSGSPNSKLIYLTMLKVRTTVVKSAASQLAEAVTIATRYSVVREQGAGAESSHSIEKTIMWYKSQHFRILTIIAKAYAILFASRTLDAAYEGSREEQQEGAFTSLPYVHGLASGIKAWSTQIAADGAEDARKCCGGQGYLSISGLPDKVAAITALATLEGENYALWQQLGRYLFKCLDRIAENEDLDPRMQYLADGYIRHLDGINTLQYISRPCTATGHEFLDLDVQLSIYRHTALRLILAAHTALYTSEKPYAEAWNDNLMLTIAAARAHNQYTVVSSFISHINSLPSTTSPALKTVLSYLSALFALSEIINPQSINAISYVEDNHLSHAQLDSIRDVVNGLLEQLLPESVALTDAWDFTDASLCSAIGMADGDVYETVMEWVKQLPINRKAWDEDGGVFQPGWREMVAPVLKGKL
ncbi:acyl-CoA oxidase [Amniculicola lignicola CBS 123094]|uniref:Acyl-coenzyme A oxidase n=1 Tax=Amniculicola lignicola CBS 123094 TaxID=1392246 RepID=A0A6A5WEB3_9PLEO|nr:acyl-CoA oxidase [Amniculicola lignicola CBS 123094]